MDDISQGLQEITMGELPHGKEPKPFKEIAKKEKVCSTKESYSQLCQMYTAQELRQLYTPDELRRMLTSDELVQMFTPGELREMFTLAKFRDMLRVDQLSLMKFPRRKLKPRMTKAQEEALDKAIDEMLGKREVKYCGALEKGKKIIS